MALSEFRDTHSWQGAIDLGPLLVQLAEELPAGETNGLAQQLRQGMVELPAAIALDMLEKDSYTRRAVSLRLLAIIELIDKVYPALDTAQARTKLEKLIDRIASDKLTERTDGAPAHKLPTHDDHESHGGHEAHEHHQATTTPAEPAHTPAPTPNPSAVPVVAEAVAAAIPERRENEANPALKVQVSAPNQENHV
jgi:hypothetical protein